MDVHQEDGRVVNEDGQVAMAFFQELPKRVQMPDGTIYQFMPKHNISVAFIQPQHVDEVLKHQHKCCGGSVHRAFKFPNLHNVRLWLGYER